jgi:hypothetical protein
VTKCVLASGTVGTTRAGRNGWGTATHHTLYLLTLPKLLIGNPNPTRLAKTFAVSLSPTT